MVSKQELQGIGRAGKAIASNGRGETVAKKEQVPIIVEAFVKVGDKEVNVDALTDEQRQQLGTWIKATVAQEFYRGQAVFSMPG